MSILVLLPVILLLLAALSIAVVRQVRPGYGYAWLLGAGLAVVTWVLVLVLRWQVVPPFTTLVWRPSEGPLAVMTFQLDQASWPYVFSLAGLMAGVIITAPARLSQEVTPFSWMGGMVMTSAGMLASMAVTPLALIIAWTIIDFMELGMILSAEGNERYERRSMFALAMRVAGTILVIWTLIVSRSLGEPLTLMNVPPEAGIFLLLAAGLRLGVIPLHLPYAPDIKLRRGFGTIFRMVAAASSLVVLSRLPPTAVAPAWLPYLITITAFVAFYGAVMWLSAENALTGRPYWMIALAAMAIVCVLRGQSQMSTAWGVALILSGGVVFLFSVWRPEWLALLTLGWIGLSGLPYSPGASGWLGLIKFPFDLLDVIYLLAHSLLMIGYFRHGIKAGRLSDEDTERWLRVIYPFGLSMILATQWLIGVFGWPGSFTPGVWWAALASTLLAFVVFLGTLRLGHFFSGEAGGLHWFTAMTKPIGRILSDLFRLEWLYQIIGFFYRLVQNLVGFVAMILEGEGGVLWALMLMVLLISLIRPGVNP